MKPNWKAAIVALLCVSFFAFVGAGVKKGIDTPPTPKTLTERLDDRFERESIASQILKRHLRDPDSLVIESTSDCKWRTFGTKRLLAFLVTYRAKNGFGGYNREQRWLTSEDSDGKFWGLRE